jgi:hypothetical protein
MPSAEIRTEVAVEAGWGLAGPANTNDELGVDDGDEGCPRLPW